MYEKEGERKDDPIKKKALSPYNQMQEQEKVIEAKHTCCAFREILQSLQCESVQYTFLGQYPIKLEDFFSLCKISHPAWLQHDHKKLGPSEMRKQFGAVNMTVLTIWRKPSTN